MHVCEVMRHRNEQDCSREGAVTTSAHLRPHAKTPVRDVVEAWSAPSRGMLVVWILFTAWFAAGFAAGCAAGFAAGFAAGTSPQR